ncbi:MAG: hypothetical protein ABSG64_14060 [Solirubrobacteraceae bacterium]
MLALQTEHPELDFKRTIDLQDAGSTIELAKDVGAMQALGGYIVVGVNDSGVPTGELDAADLRAFDEASLTQKMLRYLAGPLHLRTRVAETRGHQVPIIFVGPHPAGCAFFRADGTYQRNGRSHTAFREGDVFFRDGTRSTRMTQAGFEAVIARRVAAAKTEWFDEQREVRRHERDALETTTEAHGPLGTVNLDMRPREMSVAALELSRANDEIALRHLLNDATARARRFIDAGDIEDQLAALLDSLICLAATFLEYEQWQWFDRLVELLREVYSMPLVEGDAERFGYNVRIPPDEPAPRVWLQLMTRLYALGGLAVRRHRWAAIRTLTLQLPERLISYDTNWLRHAITMISRAEHLQSRQGDHAIELSLLSLAHAQAARLDCLRPDGIRPDDELLLTSLAQFDVLSNIVAVADAPDLGFGQTFFPNFARLHQSRVQPAVVELLRDGAMREALGVQDDGRLAVALRAVGDVASREGFRYDGFRGWAHTPVADFIAGRLPADE